MQGLRLNEQMLSAKVGDIVRRAGQISNLDGEMSALSDKLNQTKWYQFIENNSLNRQLSEVQQARAAYANELKALHGINPEGAIEAATKLNAQIQKAQALSKRISTPESIEQRQRAIEKNFSQQCLEVQRSEKIGLSKDFYRQRNLDPTERAALKAAEKKFQATSAVTWRQQGKSYVPTSVIDGIKQKAADFQQQASLHMQSWVKGIRQHTFFQGKDSQPKGIVGQRRPETMEQKERNLQNQHLQSENRKLQDQIKMLEEELRRKSNQKPKPPSESNSGSGGSDQAQRERNLNEREQDMRQREAAMNDRQAKEATQKTQTAQEQSTQAHDQASSISQGKGTSSNQAQPPAPTQTAAANQKQPQSTQPTRSAAKPTGQTNGQPIRSSANAQNQAQSSTPTRTSARSANTATPSTPTRTSAQSASQPAAQPTRTSASSQNQGQASTPTRTSARSSSHASPSGQGESSSQASGKSSRQSSGRTR